MTKPYMPRKKKIIVPAKRMKRVRIDHKTQIEVSVSIPDEQARERYYARHKIEPVPDNIALYPIPIAECFKEIPVLGRDGDHG